MTTLALVGLLALGMLLDEVILLALAFFVIRFKPHWIPRMQSWGDGIARLVAPRSMRYVGRWTGFAPDPEECCDRVGQPQGDEEGEDENEQEGAV